MWTREPQEFLDLPRTSASTRSKTEATVMPPKKNPKWTQEGGRTSQWNNSICASACQSQCLMGTWHMASPRAVTKLCTTKWNSFFLLFQMAQEPCKCQNNMHFYKKRKKCYWYNNVSLTLRNYYMPETFLCILFFLCILVSYLLNATNTLWGVYPSSNSQPGKLRHQKHTSFCQGRTHGQLMLRVLVSTQYEVRVQVTDLFSPFRIHPHHQRRDTQKEKSGQKKDWKSESSQTDWSPT